MPLQWLLNTKLKIMGVSSRNFLLFYKMKPNYNLALLFFLCCVLQFNCSCVSCSLCFSFLVFHVLYASLFFSYSCVSLLPCFVAPMFCYSCASLLLHVLSTSSLLCFNIPTCSFYLIAPMLWSYCALMVLYVLP